jgi:hypothetical protein
MSSIKHFENEKLKDKTTYFLWLIFLIFCFLGLQLLLPIIRPNRFTGSTVEWAFTVTIIIVTILYFVLHRRFESLVINTYQSRITLTTSRLIGETKNENFNLLDISFKLGKDQGNLRKAPTQFVEMYDKRSKLIKIEKTEIGETTFDNILAELEELNKLKIIIFK